MGQPDKALGYLWGSGGLAPSPLSQSISWQWVFSFRIGLFIFVGGGKKQPSGQDLRLLISCRSAYGACVPLSFVKFKLRHLRALGWYSIQHISF